MKFSCDRCHKRFSTTDEPVPGRVYRIPCKCGNTIVVQLEAAGDPAAALPVAVDAPPRRTAPPPLPVRAAPPAVAPVHEPAVQAGWTAAAVAAIADDPFAPRREQPGLGVLLACASEEVTPTVLGTPLALRDPDAPEVSTLYDPDPADPFAEELRRTRTHALAVGGAAGAVGGAALAALATVLLLHPWSSPGAAPAPASDAIAAQVAPVAPERPAMGRRAPVRAASVATQRARAAAAPSPIVEASLTLPAAAAPAPAAPPPPAPAPTADRVAADPEPHGAPRLEPVVEDRTEPASAESPPQHTEARAAEHAPAVQEAAPVETPAESPPADPPPVAAAATPDAERDAP